MMTERKKHQKQELRILKVLSKQSESGFGFERSDDKYCIEFGQRRHSFEPSVINKLASAGLIVISGSVMRISSNGKTALYQKLGHAPDERTANSISHDGTQAAVDQVVSFNSSESPLMRLYLRKTKSGKPYITVEELHAGERFRQDFERGRLQPRVTSNYSSPLTGSPASKNGGEAAEISDFALDARKRIYGALDLLGPQLGGVSLDICCFLKGFELVERERNWPPRSAKLMLKTALMMLSTHYGFLPARRNSDTAIQSWGSADYRPSIGV